MLLACMGAAELRRSAAMARTQTARSSSVQPPPTSSSTMEQTHATVTTDAWTWGTAVLTTKNIVEVRC